MTLLENLIQKYTETYSIIDIINLDDWYSRADGERPTWLLDRLKKIHKEAYENNERILLTLTQEDEYAKDTDEVGLILQTLVDVLNLLDISSFFVTVITVDDKLMHSAQTWMNKHIVDPIPIKFEFLPGQALTKKIVNRKSNLGYNYNSALPLKLSIADLTTKQKELLLENKHFCMYPWLHLYVDPSGKTMPCCSSGGGGADISTLGNTNETSLQTIWNNDATKKLRVRMLNDQPSSGCERCYEQEASGFFSMRNSANKHHGHHINLVDQTHSDGHLDQFKMIYWDVRFSNLCNLKCRSCGPGYSSQWYQDQIKIAPDYANDHKALITAGKFETDLWEQLIEHIDHVEQIYFAGGEPLLMEEHYLILEELERRKKFNVRLIYNTNFTETRLKNRSVFDYWRKFDSVSVGASLDGMYQHGEYIRKGTNWNVVEHNRQQMMEICPNVDFYASATLSILNAWHLPDFHRAWVEKGFIKPQDFNVNILTYPSFYRIDIATDEYKKALRDKYHQHLAWLSPLDKLRRASNGFESALTFLVATDNTKLIPDFWKKTKQLDQIRNENLLDVIPELTALQ
jgi:radical SAM protein with 4Fe4S-binding SPASM domain